MAALEGPQNRENFSCQAAGVPSKRRLIQLGIVTMYVGHFFAFSVFSLNRHHYFLESNKMKPYGIWSLQFMRLGVASTPHFHVLLEA